MGGQCCSALADWRGGAASWRAEWARQLVFATTSANNRRRWLIPNSRTIEVAVTFFSEAIRAADLMGIPKEMKFGVMIPIGWPQNDFVKVKRIKTKSVILKATGKKTPKRPRASAQGARSSTEPELVIFVRCIWMQPVPCLQDQDDFASSSGAVPPSR